MRALRSSLCESPEGPELHEFEQAGYGASRRIRVATRDDGYAAVGLVDAVASGARVGADAARAAMIVASELAHNLARHAGGGVLEIAAADAQGIVRVTASDSGPAFRDLELAFCDGSTDAGPILPEEVPGRRGIGAGLGAVRRLSEAVVVRQGTAGKSIVAYVRERRARVPRLPCPVYLLPALDG